MKRMERRLRGWKRLLVWVLAVYLVGSAIGTAAFQVFYYARYEPEVTAAEIMDGTGFTFRSGDSMLYARLYDAPEEQGIIIMLHGFHGGAEDCAQTAAAFRDAGWDVMIFDGTGTGASEGASLRGLQQMVIDGGAAIDWAGANSEGPILLWGYSMGGYAAAVLAGNRPEVRGAAVFSAFESPVEMMTAKAREKAGFLAELERPFMMLCEWLMFGENADRHASAEILDGEPPVLVVQGGEDTMVPKELSLYRLAEETGNMETVFLPEAGHGEAAFPEGQKEREERLRTVLAFYQRCLEN